MIKNFNIIFLTSKYMKLAKVKKEYINFRDYLACFHLKNTSSYSKIINLLFKLNSSINPRKKSWWIEIKTATPRCIYFFGPFDGLEEAKQKQTGYVDDLVQERAVGIKVEIKQCQPTCLTIFEEF
jgi:hypothetical protein